MTDETNRRDPHLPTGAAASSDREPSCEQYEELMEQLVAVDTDGSSLSPVAVAELLSHLRGCGRCSEVFELHAELLRVGDAIKARQSARASALEDHLGDVRRAVLGQLELEGRLSSDASASGSGPTGPGSVSVRPSSLVRLAAAAAAGGLVVASAWWLDRQRLSGADDLVAGATSPASALLAGLTAAGAELDEAPYDLHNVRIREVDGTTVALSFDLATHLEVERPKQDPLVLEAMVRSIRGGSDLGGRLKAIDFADSRLADPGSARAPQFSERVRDALIQAMLEDPSIAVRMEAQRLLVQDESDPVIEAAMLRVLREGSAVQLRLQALDSLAARGVDNDRLLDAVRSGHQESMPALEHRTVGLEAPSY